MRYPYAENTFCDVICESEVKRVRRRLPRPLEIFLFICLLDHQLLINKYQLKMISTTIQYTQLYTSILYKTVQYCTQYAGVYIFLGRWGNNYI